VPDNSGHALYDGALALRWALDLHGIAGATTAAVARGGLDTQVVVLDTGTVRAFDDRLRLVSARAPVYHDEAAFVLCPWDAICRFDAVVAGVGGMGFQSPTSAAAFRARVAAFRSLRSSALEALGIQGRAKGWTGGGPRVVIVQRAAHASRRIPNASRVRESIARALADAFPLGVDSPSTCAEIGDAWDCRGFSATVDVVELEGAPLDGQARCVGALRSGSCHRRLMIPLRKRGSALLPFAFLSPAAQRTRNCFVRRRLWLFIF
jgi:hypothetical protein